MENNLSEEQLIDYIKPILKAEGFKKKAKRWTKDIGEFTLVFYIQGSCFDKNDYYARPGIFINEIPHENLVYGHIMTGIEITTAEEILKTAEQFFKNWTNKKYFKDMVSQFIEWDKRNPLEKRRAGNVDYEKDPVPSWSLFDLSENVISYILENF